MAQHLLLLGIRLLNNKRGQETTRGRGNAKPDGSGRHAAAAATAAADAAIKPASAHKQLADRPTRSLKGNLFGARSVAAAGEREGRDESWRSPSIPASHPHSHVALANRLAVRLQTFDNIRRADRQLICIHRDLSFLIVLWAEEANSHGCGDGDGDGRGQQQQ